MNGGARPPGRPIILRDSNELRSLACLRASILALWKRSSLRNSWQRAAGLVLEAAERRREIASAAEAVESTLSVEAKFVHK